MKPLNKLEQTYYKILSGMEYSSACKLYKEENVVNSVIGQNARDCAKVAVDLAKRALDKGESIGSNSESFGWTEWDCAIERKAFWKSEWIEP